MTVNCERCEHVLYVPWDAPFSVNIIKVIASYNKSLGKHRWALLIFGHICS